MNIARPASQYIPVLPPKITIVLSHHSVNSVSIFPEHTKCVVSLIGSWATNGGEKELGKFHHMNNVRPHKLNSWILRQSKVCMCFLLITTGVHSTHTPCECYGIECYDYSSSTDSAIPKDWLHHINTPCIEHGAIENRISWVCILITSHLRLYISSEVKSSEVYSHEVAW